ncbi:MAG: hypothetical protein RBT47_02595 [Anaerolineae bacterium]|jgi:hypothetical protein|nr:hypothetical protein [Anaerolineae bacterium]
MGQNRTVKIVFGALLLIIGLGAAAFMLANLAEDLSLWIFGRKTTGYVTDQIAECAGAEEGEGEMTCEYFIQYEFLTSSGEVITRTASVAAQEWGGVAKGNPRWPSQKPEGFSPATGVYQEQEQVPQTTMGGAEQGSPVAVIYFPPYPQHNRLDDTRYILILLLSYLPFAVIGGGALWGGWHLLKPATMNGSPEWPHQKAV